MIGKQREKDRENTQRDKDIIILVEKIGEKR